MISVCSDVTSDVDVTIGCYIVHRSLDADVTIGCYMVNAVHVTTPFLRPFLFGTNFFRSHFIVVEYDFLYILRQEQTIM